MQRGNAKMRALDWADVPVFLALARQRSLAAAARSLGIDKSTASRRIASMEEALGARLFLRTRDGLRPSPLAERLATHAERMEQEARALETAAAAGDEEIAGVVRVATTEALAAHLVARGLLDLSDTHPGLVVELAGGNRPVDVARGAADLALRVTPPEDASLRARVVARLGLGLFAAPAYLRVRGTPAGPDGLDGHDVVVPSGELAQLPEAKWLSSRAGVRIAFLSNSMPALVAAAVAGRGLVALTSAWGEATPGLDRVMPIEGIAPRRVWLLAHPDTSRRGAVRVVADRIARIMKEASRAG
jgi:DNA-binding transcriptional LysR family regulator